MIVNRELQRAVFRLADQTSTRITGASGGGRIVATVTTVVAAGAGDGVAALVKVTWRGNEVTAHGYSAAYTPAVNDRVVCDVIDNQLFVAYRITGQP